MSQPPVNLKAALEKQLEKLSKRPAQALLYGAVVTAIAYIGGATLPPPLMIIATTIGGNLLSNMIERVAQKGDLTEEDFEQLQNSIDQRVITDLLTQDQFNRSVFQLVRHLDLQSNTVIERLGRIEAKQATRQQIEELANLVREALAIRPSVFTPIPRTPARPPRLFLSYARADDEPFVKRLYEDLSASRDESSIWWDQVSMPSRGLTFTQEIRDAINSVDRLLVVIGPHAIKSTYVTAEWKYALSICKTIIPILRLGLGNNNDLEDFGQLPEELAGLQCFDFRTEARYADEFRKLADELSNPTIPLASLLGVPALPANYLPRLEDLRVLNELILKDINHPVVLAPNQQTTVVQGMAGIGKSIIAATFCRECATRYAFLDGVVWVQVGREPNILSIVTETARALGDSYRYYTDEYSAGQSLQKLLSNKACLIVLDDVWKSSHAQPFLDVIAGTRCRLIITTRDKQMASLLGANEHKVSLLDVSQATAFLEKWTGRSDPEFATISRRLGYLPLALKIAGAVLREDYSSPEWLQHFDRVSRMTIDPNAPSRDESLEISFGLSVDAAFIMKENLKNLYFCLSIFPKGIGIPQPVVLKLWKQIEPSQDDFDLRRISDRVVRLALADRLQDGRLTLHDLLHDFCIEKLGQLHTLTHASLLRAYNPNAIEWHQVPDDGYLYTYLAYHLVKSDQISGLVALLTRSSGWLEIKYEATAGDNSYIADVDLAISSLPNEPTRSDDVLSLVQLFAVRDIVKQRAVFYTDSDFQTLCWLGREVEALNHLRLRNSANYKLHGLRSLCIALTAMGKPISREILSEIQKTIESYSGGGSFSSWKGMMPYQALISVLIRSGYLIEADLAAHAIPHVEEKIVSLCDLAMALDDNSRKDRASEILRDAAAFVDDLPYHSSYGWYLVKVALAAVQIEDYQAAEGFFAEAEKAVTDLGEKYADTKTSITFQAKSFRSLLSELAEVRQWSEATAAFAASPRSVQTLVWGWTEALWRLASDLGDRGEDPRAMTALDLAHRLAQASRNSALTAHSLVKLANKLAQERQPSASNAFSAARTAINEVKELNERRDAMHALAIALIKAGRVSEGERIALDIPPQNQRSRQATARIALASVYADSGDHDRANAAFEEATRLSNEISSPEDRVAVQRELVVALLKAGRKAEANNVVEQLSKSISSGNNGLAEVFVELAKFYAQADQEEDAITTFSQAYEVVRTAETTTPAQRKLWPHGQLADVIDDLSDRGRTQLAEWAATQLEQFLLDAVDEYTLTSLTSLMSAVALALARGGQTDQANAILRQATLYTSASSYRVPRVDLLTAIAALAKAERFAESERLAGVIDDPSQQSKALTDLGTALVRAHRSADGRRHFERAYQISSGIGDPEKRFRALHEMMKAVTEVNAEMEATKKVRPPLFKLLQRDRFTHRLYNAVLQTSPQIADPDKRSELLLKWALELHKMNTWRRAAVVLAKAAETAIEIKNAQRRATRLVEVADAQMRCGHQRAAEATFQTAWIAIDQIGTLDEGMVAAIRGASGQTGVEFLVPSPHGKSDRREDSYSSAPFISRRDLIRLNLSRRSREHSRSSMPVVRQSHDDGVRFVAVAPMAEALARGHHLEGALRVASSIRSPRLHDEILSGVVVACLSSGDIQSAADLPQLQSVVRDVRDATQLTRALKAMAEAYIKLRDFREADAVISQIPNSQTQVSLRLRRAVAVARARSNHEANSLFEEIQREILGLPPSDETRSDRILDLTRALIETDQLNAATKLVTDALSVRDHVRSYAVHAIAAAWMRSGDIVNARKTVELIVEPFNRGRMLLELSDTLQKLGRTSESHAVLLEAFEAVNMMKPDPWTPPYVTSADWIGLEDHPLATHLLQVGLLQEALSVICGLEFGLFWIRLLNWLPLFEAQEPGLSVKIVAEVAKLTSWVFPKWRIVCESLADTYGATK